MANSYSDVSVLILTFIVGATVLVLVYITNLFKAPRDGDSSKSQETQQSQRKAKSSSDVNSSSQKSASASSKKKQQQQQQQQHSEKWNRDSKQNYTHPWLLTSLKGHSGTVLDMDFSSNGKFLATCAEDRAILVWSTKDWHQKDHKSIRLNVQYDHASLIRWSPDSKAFIVLKATENVVEVCKVVKKADGWISSITKAMEYPKFHEENIIGLGIACNGKYIMSCSEKTDMMLWDLKGQQLTKFDTYLMSTYCARISPCGRFVVASGFAPDVKVWEVCFTKTGEFSQVSRAFELPGHTSGVFDVSFSADSSRIATVSKDGTWKVFNINVEYKKGEDPHLMITGKYDQAGAVSHVALSPNGEVVAITNGSSLQLFSVLSGNCDKTITGIYSGSISSVQFDSLGKYVLTTGEKHVRVFHNVTGYRVTIASTKEKLQQNVSSAQRERMEQQIRDAEEFLSNIGEKY